MLSVEQTTDTCLVVHFSGKITGDKYQKFLNALNDRLATHEKVSLEVELSDFEFYGDFEAAKKDFKFGFGDYRKIHRAAFVGNKKWIEWFTRFDRPVHTNGGKEFSRRPV